MLFMYAFVTSCAGCRHNMPPPLRPWPDLLTLKVASVDRCTRQTDIRQTPDVRRHTASSLNASA